MIRRIAAITASDDIEPPDGYPQITVTVVQNGPLITYRLSESYSPSPKISVFKPSITFEPYEDKESASAKLMTFPGMAAAGFLLIEMAFCYGDPRVRTYK